MVHPLIIGGAAAIGGKIIVDALEEPPEHNDLLKQTYDTIESSVDSDIETPADHGVGEDDGGTLSIDGIEGRPDLVIKGFDIQNLIIEVETTNALEERPEEVINQVEGFRKQGYTRVLVVPKKSVEIAEGLAEEVSGKVQVKTPNSVGELV